MLRPTPFLLFLSLALLAGAACSQELRVSHWWKSDSEREAAAVLAAEARRAHIGWRELEVGDGVSVNIILRSRVLTDDLPDVVQVNTVPAPMWMISGQSLPLDEVAAAGGWDRKLLPVIARMIRSDGVVQAVPLGVHRANTLFFNRRLFHKLGLLPPRDWTEFEKTAERLRRAGITPLAQSSEPDEIGFLLQNIVLASAGPAFHKRIYLDGDEAAIADPRLAQALTQLRRLKRWMPQPLDEQGWVDVVRRFVGGEAAMMVAGDWVKAQLRSGGWVIDADFGCAAAPGTAAYHLYVFDALMMMNGRAEVRPAQRKLAARLMSDRVQERYNFFKGSVPGLRRPDLAAMDSCARESWRLLSSSPDALVPTLSAGVVGDEARRTEFSAEVHRFFRDDRIGVQDSVQRLIRISRAIKKTNSP
ncbi:ABC transporter substrate-binding protein [Duganella radicis]|uniref:Extracellular solute-binding protein n=1 Tax=Duganella radicis TaxID=551988 RepID=A0A6L6PGN9_9BURK|nr:ABC transporter substrate-binding protein [Duganella radicis]MTV37747.1 extracellular solute-binding protein [Duganella radicis]